jgi:hypothetical protein
MLGSGNKAKGICKCGEKIPQLTQAGNWEVVAIIECISMDGRVLPPICTFKGTKLLVGWFSHLDKSNPAAFICSPKGWADGELRLNYLSKYFDKYSRNM